MVRRYVKSLRLIGKVYVVQNCGLSTEEKCEGLMKDENGLVYVSEEVK